MTSPNTQHQAIPTTAEVLPTTAEVMVLDGTGVSSVEVIELPEAAPDLVVDVTGAEATKLPPNRQMGFLTRDQVVALHSMMEAYDAYMASDRVARHDALYKPTAGDEALTTLLNEVDNVGTLFHDHLDLL